MTNDTATELTSAQCIDATAQELGLTMTTQFVPWSQSRNKSEKQPSLNWIVTLHKDAPPRAFLTTNYGAGMGHCPSYKAIGLGAANSVDRHNAVKHECETGYGASLYSGRKPIVPQMRDVLYSLAMDASVLDSSCFEDWANELGYESDSRKAESIYHSCMEIALKLRNALGEAGLEKLRNVCQDY